MSDTPRTDACFEKYEGQDYQSRLHNMRATSRTLERERNAATLDANKFQAERDQLRAELERLRNSIASMEPAR